MSVFVRLVVCLAVVIFSVQVVQAEEDGGISTWVFLKGNIIMPESKPAFGKGSIFAHWMYKWAGAGFEANWRPDNQCFDFHLNFTAQKGPFYFLLGGVADSNGGGYAKQGLWYINSHWGVKFLFCGVNYIAVNEKEASYLDLFLEPTYQISEKVSVGLNLCYDHWWEDHGHNWFLAGPIVYYRINKYLSPFIRYSHDWDLNGGETGNADAIRIGLKVIF